MLGSIPRPPVYVEYVSASLPVITASRVEMEKESDEEYDDEDYELDDIYVRTKFFESWLWTDVKLPEEPQPDG